MWRVSTSVKRRIYTVLIRYIFRMMIYCAEGDEIYCCNLLSNA